MLCSIIAPALDGRYWTKWPDHEAGRRGASGGITKKTATKVEIAAEILYLDHFLPSIFSSGKRGPSGRDGCGRALAGPAVSLRTVRR